MKKIVAMIISAWVMVNSSMMTLAATKDSTVNVDKLYADAYDAVRDCQNTDDQQLINQAREAVKKLIGVVDWAVGEFSKQIDAEQNGILQYVVRSIVNNQKSPAQSDINHAREIINELPDVNWRKSYSSALDKAQDILIRRAVDKVEECKNLTSYNDSKSYNKKMEALSAIRELVHAENLDVKNFAEKLLDDNGWTLDDCEKLVVKQIIDHEDTLYNYYGLCNDEYLMELNNESLEDVNKILNAQLCASGINMFNVQDCANGEIIDLYIHAILPSNSEHKSILFVLEGYDQFKEGHECKIVNNAGENFVRFTNDAKLKHKICNGFIKTDYNDFDADDVLKNIKRYVNRNEKMSPYSLETAPRFNDEISNCLAQLNEKEIVTCKHLFSNDGNPYMVYDINDDEGSSYEYKSITLNISAR